jgi:hypothetical protein
MFIVNIQDVQIAEIADPKHPNQKVLILNYLNRGYVLLQVFPLSRLDAAQNLWRHLTDDRSQVCLIIKSPEDYSIWVENIEQSATIEDRADPRLEFIFRAQMCLIDGLWAEVGALLGHSQAAAFGKEIIISIPTIGSIKDLLAVISIAMKPDQSIDAYAISGQQLVNLYQEIQRLGGKYLGKNYTKELLSDFQSQLSPRLQQSFQDWLLTKFQK